MREHLMVLTILHPRSHERRWCDELTIDKHANGWFAWFVWEGVCYVAVRTRDGADVTDAPAGAVAYARTLWELER